MTSAQPARAVQLVAHDGGIAQPARAVLLSPWQSVAPPVGPSIPLSTLTSGMGVGMGWNDAPGRDEGKQDKWAIASTVASGDKVGWLDSPGLDSQTDGPFNQAGVKESYTDILWSKPQGEPGTESRIPHTAPPPKELDHGSSWDGSMVAKAYSFNAGYSAPPPKERESLYWYFSVDLFGHEHPQWITNTYAPPVRSSPEGGVVIDGELKRGAHLVSTSFAFGEAPPADFYVRPVQPRNSSLSVVNTTPQPVERELEVNWGQGQWRWPYPSSYINWVAQPPEPQVRPAAPPIMEVYCFMPTISITTVPAGQELTAVNASLSLDRDTWAWRMKATLGSKADLDLVRPDSNGPKEILIEINGHQWSGLVEAYERNALFGKNGWTISARSLSAELSSPYAPKLSQEIVADYSAAQLADFAVQGTGWTINWLAHDWVVKGGAWAFQELDPMAQVSRLAAAVGAKVRPHQTLKRLDIVSRYPASPHKWDQAALDAILPDSLVLDLGGRWIPGTAYNRAIVAGSQVGGVLVSGVRSGTAGDLLAPQVVDPLITTSTAGQERARIEMDLGGNRESISITTMLGTKGDPDGPSLYLPQHLIEVQEVGETWRSQVGSVNITAVSTDKALKVRQKIEVERYHA